MFSVLITVTVTKSPGFGQHLTHSEAGNRGEVRDPSGGIAALPDSAAELVGGELAKEKEKVGNVSKCKLQ